MAATVKQLFSPTPKPERSRRAGANERGPSQSRRFARDLRSSERLPDEHFDRLLEAAWQASSPTHWTPLQVCRQAARLAALTPTERLLDVGCGVGKLCIIGSLLTRGLFTGVEQRPHLVAEAKRVAAQLGARTQFIHGDALELDWARYQVFYFYNPFDEARFAVGLKIDESIPFGEEVFRALVSRTQERLAGLASGTRVLTFHGLGGPLPDSYELTASERASDGVLELWTKAR